MNNNFFDDFKKYDWPTLGYILLPKYAPSPEDIQEYGLDLNKTSFENLKLIVRQGYKKRIAEKLIPEGPDDLVPYVHRVKDELDVFDKLGFSDYLLMINSITDFARRNGIISGAGRGSCVGSLVLFLIGVTQVDPIRAKLLFERFISAERAERKEIDGKMYIDSSSLPDVDLDFPMTRKADVLAYIESRFPNRVASISNFSRLTSKVLIKDVVKIMTDAKEEEAQAVSDMIQKRFGKVEDINAAMKDNKGLIKWAADHVECIEVATKLADLIRQTSVHASGVIVTENAIDETLPLGLTKEKDSKRICCSYDMVDAQKLGIKIDNLGLTTLDLIDECLKMTGKKIHEINPEDESIYNYLQHRDEFHGLFQIASGIGEQTIKKVRPRNIEELTDCISLGRPGSFVFIDDYVKVKEGRKEADIHPNLIDILEPTKGILVFQEQLMAISVRMGGFSLKEADKIRKIVGKKLKHQMPEWEDKFIQGSIKNGYTENFAQRIWSSFVASGDYSFNKSHARAYATLTAITTYLKAHHPLEFFLADLKVAMADSKPQEVISKIYSEMLKCGIKLLPPHLINSGLDFQIEGQAIRFGLMAIKGLKEKVIQKVERFRVPSANLFQTFAIAKQAGLSIGALSALIQAGACDVPEGKKRSKVVAEAQLWNILTDKEREIFTELGPQFEFDMQNILVHLRDKAAAKDTAGEKFKRGELRTSRINTIRTKFEPYRAILKKNSSRESFTNWWYQRKLLGFSYNETLKDIWNEVYNELIDIVEVQSLEHQENCCFMAVIKDVRKGISQKTRKDGTKTKYLKLTAGDESGEVTVLIFNENIEVMDASNPRELAEGDIVRVLGKRFNDAVFAETINLHSEEVFTKLSDLKNESDAETAEADETPVQVKE